MYCDNYAQFLVGYQKQLNDKSLKGVCFLIGQKKFPSPHEELCFLKGERSSVPNKKQTNEQTHPVIQLFHFIKIGLVSEVTKKKTIKKHEDLEKLKYRKPLRQSK